MPQKKDFFLKIILYDTYNLFQSILREGVIMKTRWNKINHEWIISVAGWWFMATQFIILSYVCIQNFHNKKLKKV